MRAVFNKCRDGFLGATLGLIAAATPVAAQDTFTLAASPSGPPSEIAVTDRGRVRMHVADVPLSTVLHLLSLEGRRNIIASPGVAGSVTANLYDVTFEEALTAVLIPNGAGFRTQGNFTYVYTNEELAEIESANAPPLETHLYRLNYASATEVRGYLEPLVGEDGSVTASAPAATGLASAPEDGGGQASAMQDFVIVTASPAVHQLVANLIAQLDVRPRQVLVEARILRAELSDDNALGIDFTLVGGVDLELLNSSSNGILDVSLGGLPQNRFERFNAAATTDLTGNIPSGGLSVGIIKDQVAVFLHALEEVTNITVLANPKILALNRQKAQVIVGRRDGFLTTTVTQTQAIQTVEFLETGTQLIFRPFIGDDGFIRVELHPEDSVGFVNAQGLPSEQTTELTTNVLIRDGETILIGGLFREVTTDARSQVPGLGSLPGIGMFFRSNSESTRREEIIILLTIHIVSDHEAYAEASRKQYEDIERLRVGVRQGLMWHGRERLAQAQYHRAAKTFAEGDFDRALWHVNLALHNQPRFLPAIEMKERILGERAWDHEGTGGRTFLHSVITRKKGYALPPFGRPKPPIMTDVKPAPPTGDVTRNSGS